MAVRHLTNRDADGTTLGYNSSDLVGFYGATPIAQPSATAQSALAAATITDGSTGTAAATNGIAALTGTYNSTLLINAIATMTAQINANSALLAAIRTAMVNLGLMKGSA